MLNTFFFGYLSLKWRRLVRTLILLSLIYAIIGMIISICISIEKGYIESDTRDFIVSTLGLIVLTPIVSYILKPFAVKEDS
jgi:hypothetical protein